MKGLKLCY